MVPPVSCYEFSHDGIHLLRRMGGFVLASEQNDLRPLHMLLKSETRCVKQTNKMSNLLQL